MEDGYYIINRMYAGDYLSGNNIGHEIINLFSNDRGDNYIYVNSSGYIDPQYNGKIKGIILVRKSTSINKLEVLGIAKVDEASQIAFKSKKPTSQERQAEQKAIIDQYLAQHPVSYGGVPLSELFANNQFRGGLDTYHTITFKTKELLLPYLDEARKVYITDRACPEPSRHQLNDINFPKQSLRQYIGSKTHPKAYHEITKLVDDDTLWDRSRKAETLKSIRQDLAEENSLSLLNIIGKQDDENVFSNLIAYFLSNDKHLLRAFCSEVLDIDNISDEATIEREKSTKDYTSKSRIDLFIEDDQHAIVIENKIKSEVNSVEERHNFTGELIKTQLEDYYNYVEKNFQNHNKKYFILMPNYHHIDLKKYKHSEKYQKLTYADLSKFFDSHKYESDNPTEQFYYEDFKKALRRHAADYYDDQYAAMKRRFIRRILECRKSL